MKAEILCSTIDLYCPHKVRGPWITCCTAERWRCAENVSVLGVHTAPNYNVKLEYIYMYIYICSFSSFSCLLFFFNFLYCPFLTRSWFPIWRWKFWVILGAYILSPSQPRSSLLLFRSHPRLTSWNVTSHKQTPMCPQATSHQRRTSICSLPRTRGWRSMWSQQRGSGPSRKWECTERLPSWSSSGQRYAPRWTASQWAVGDK